jgi:hypothetical protein
MQKIKMNGKTYEYPYSVVLMFEDNHQTLKVLSAKNKKTMPQMLSLIIENYMSHEN